MRIKYGYAILVIGIIFLFKLCYTERYYFKKQIEDDFYILKEESISDFQIIKLNDNDWDSWLMMVFDVVEVYKDDKYIEVYCEGRMGAKYFSFKIGETNYPDEIKEINAISIDVKKRIFISSEIDSH